MRQTGLRRARWGVTIAWLAVFLGSGRVLASDAGSQRSKGRAILVFDASGSMNDAVRGGRDKRIVVARAAMRDLMSRWDANTDLGLMVYGHRESPRDKAKSCKDIETVVAPGPADAQRVRSIVDFVDRVRPRGETPLTTAVLQAAEMLKADDEPGTVILVTDGEESCGEDPCEAARRLAESGVDLTVHVIGFNVPDPAVQKQLRCFPDATGGTFRDASDGRSLSAALESAMESIWYRLEAQQYVFSSLPYEVKWQGPNRKCDAITLAPKGAPAETRAASASTTDGSPAKMIGPEGSGPYEVRYVSGRRNRVILALDVTLRGGPATLDAPASVPAGSEILVSWTGPNVAEDRIAILPRAEADEKYRFPDFSAQTSDANPLHLRAYSEPGDYELRYLAVRGGRVLARRPIQITAVVTSVEAPATVAAGEEFDVSFEGPKAKDDRVVLVSKSTEDGSYLLDAAFTRLATAGSPLRVAAFSEPGDYEARYVSGADGRVLARTAISITPARVSIEAPAEAKAATEIDVGFSGPKRRGDKLVLVEAGTKEGAYVMSDKRTRPAAEGHVRLTLPSQPGEYEIRYMAAADGRSLAVAKIRVAASDASLDVPSKAKAGADIDVRVKGPKATDDRILIVPATEPDGRYIMDAKYTQKVEGRDTVRLKALDEPGIYEVRYSAGADGKTLAKARVEITGP